MLIVFEGSRNTGKTYLAGRCAENLYLKTTKPPFVGYFNRFLAGNSFLDDNAKDSVWHHTTGYDVSLLSANVNGCFMDTILDRGFMSNVVLGIAGGRITREAGFEYIDYLFDEGMIKNMVIVMVTANRGGRDEEAETSKDSWHILDRDLTDGLYAEIVDRYKDRFAANDVQIISIENEFTDYTVETLNKRVLHILVARPTVCTPNN